MTDDNAKQKQKDLMDVIKSASEGVKGLVREIKTGLLGCADLLRIEHNEKTFAALSEGINNLNSLIAFMEELKRGLKHLSDFNDISVQSLSRMDSSIGTFKEMLSAFERKDWILLADLIQYELGPMLEDVENILDKPGGTAAEAGKHGAG